jgi:Ser/Thr protein kinase RdoA (MazF antagonist)
MDRLLAAHICALIGLGEPLAEPQPVPGGMLHRVWRLRTTQGDFAVKVLNPEIVRRPDARDAYRRCERIATAMVAGDIPAVAALERAGERVWEVDGATVAVYLWIDGATLPPVAADPRQIWRIGAILARMHALQLAFAELQAPPWDRYAEGDWALLARQGAAQGVPWAEAVRAALPEIAAWNALHRQAIPALNRTLVTSHRDLDQKNVLWRDAHTPMIIDWESAGPINPAVELAGVALNWSGHAVGPPDRASFVAAVDGYRGAGGSVHDTGHDALAGCIGSWLGWLNYSMRRSLVESIATAGEQALGVQETFASLAALRSLAANLEKWASWIDSNLSQ